MKIEHLTLGGNSVVRDTENILLETVNLLKDFQIYNQAKTLPFPRTDFEVKITSTPEGAMFDIMKNNQIAFTNACSFRAEQADGIMLLVQGFSNSGPILQADIIRQPELEQFIYTIPVMPLGLSVEEMQIAGEIELYIYYSLYLAQR